MFLVNSTVDGHIGSFFLFFFFSPKFLDFLLIFYSSSLTGVSGLWVCYTGLRVLFLECVCVMRFYYCHVSVLRNVAPFIRETRRLLSTRMVETSEHRAVKHINNKTELDRHIQETGHAIRWNSPKVSECLPGWMRGELEEGLRILASEEVVFQNVKPK